MSLRPVWSEALLCAQWIAKDTSILQADSEDSNQTGRMPRLIRVFAGRTLILLVLSCRGPFHLGPSRRSVMIYHHMLLSPCDRSPSAFLHNSCLRTANALARLAWAFAGRLCDKYHNLMSWLKLSITYFKFHVSVSCQKVTEKLYSEIHDWFMTQNCHNLSVTVYFNLIGWFDNENDDTRIHLHLIRSLRDTCRKTMGFYRMCLNSLENMLNVLIRLTCKQA